MILTKADIGRGHVLAVVSSSRTWLFTGEGTETVNATVGGVIEVRQKIDGVIRVVAVFGGTFAASISSLASVSGERPTPGSGTTT